MNRGKEKGKSHEARPAALVPPKWLQFTPEEVELLIVELARKGYLPSMIGVILRDQYGVPLTKAVLNSRITEVLRKHGIELSIPEELYNLIRRAVNLRKHLEAHPKDYHSQRGLIEIESKIRRLVKYYRSRGRLPPDWKYDPATAEILISQPLVRTEKYQA